MRNTVCLFSTLDPLIGIYCTSKARSRHSFAKSCACGEAFTTRQWLHRLPVDITAGKREDCVRHGTNTCKTDGLMFFVIPREGKRKSGNRIWAWRRNDHDNVAQVSLNTFLGFDTIPKEENDFIIKQNNKCHRLYICCSVQDICMSYCAP